MVKVACIGDSITWGFTLLNPWKQSYPALLQERLGEEYEVTVQHKQWTVAMIRLVAVGLLEDGYLYAGRQGDSLKWKLAGA